MRDAASQLEYPSVFFSAAAVHLGSKSSAVKRMEVSLIGRSVRTKPSSLLVHWHENLVGSFDFLSKPL